MLTVITFTSCVCSGMVGMATGGEGSTAVISTNHETSLCGLGMVDYFLFQMLTITYSFIYFTCVYPLANN